MTRIPTPSLRPAVFVTVLSLVAALAGTAVAGSSNPTATVAASAKKTAKQAKKKANQALSAADDAQATADAAGSSASAAQSTADTAKSTADAITGRSAYGGFCDPSSGVHIDCVEVTLTLSRPGRVLVNAEAGQRSFGAPSSSNCLLELDESETGFPHPNVSLPGETSSVNTSDIATNGFGTTTVTGVLPAGAHKFGLSCNELTGDSEIYDSKISAVRVG